MTVAELLEQISSKEISEWMAYASIEPFGTFEEERRMGVLASLTAEINRDIKKRSEPFSAKDFMDQRYLGEVIEENDQEQKLVEKIMNVFSHFGIKKSL